MLLNRFVTTVFGLAVTAVSVSAQDLLELLPTPVERWTFQLLPQAELGPVEIQKGNGVFIDPSGKMAVVTTIGATVYAFGAYSGTELWSYQAPSDGTTSVGCHSAVTFSPTEGYMAFSVVDNENSLTPTT
jgi:outer membrane protein assembly factor BamB